MLNITLIFERLRGAWDLLVWQAGDENRRLVKNA